MVQPLTPKTLHLVETFEEKILPSIGKQPPFDSVIHRLSRSKEVYLLVDRNSRAEVVAKVYQGEHAVETKDRELTNMRVMESLGFCEGDMRAVCSHMATDRPVAILMERARGRDLDHHIKWAVKEGREAKLRQKLSLLAQWFATLHTKSAQDSPARGKRGYKYLMKVVRNLHESGLISCDASQDLQQAGENAVKRLSDRDRKVFVHGDSTPTNIFLRGRQVTAIDFERAKVTHRCWDLGFVGGELIHHLKWRGSNGERGRELLMEFLEKYARETSLPLHQVKADLPLYLAMGLLRIARNPWLDTNHRRWLAKMAQKHLKAD